MTIKIVLNPEIFAGKPIIEHTRYSVEHVLDLLNSGMSEQEILQEHPILNEEILNAVKAFASKRTYSALEVRDGVLFEYIPTSK